jgi:hypothetical protein
VEMDFQFGMVGSFGLLICCFGIRVDFIGKQDNSVFFVHEVAVKLCLLFLNEPLFDVEFAHVDLLQVKCEDDWQGSHQISFKSSFEFERVYQVLVFVW